NSPTTLLYESGFLPFKPGSNSRTITGLNVPLPFQTVTFTIEFRGLKTNESAGLLFYSPPTVGASFNELWVKNETGIWFPIIYSTSDFTRRANAALQFVARSEAVLDLQQTNGSASVSLLSSNRSVRLAQTFTPKVSGRLDHVDLDIAWAGAPVEVSIRDTSAGRPGTNVLGRYLLQSSSPGPETVLFYEQFVYLKSGQSYAIVLDTAQPAASSPQSPYKVSAGGGDPYPGGLLWAQTKPAGAWQPAVIQGGSTNVDAAFSLWIVPASPPVRILTPAVSEVIPFGTHLKIAADVNLPPGSTFYRARFFVGDEELEQLTSGPFEVSWKAANTGPQKIKVLVEDTFRRPFRAESRTITVLPAVPVIDRSAQINRLGGGSISVDFNSVSNEPVKIEYSDDFKTWKPAAPSQNGTGGPLSYLDDGPPKTATHPKESQQRFYRLIFGP
ncbi:MAG TPA: hypothetical protein VK633_15530, partial [Verrucomicrobiae bacterium]|nr:hypothetical protein [Verrucomicrobiae bacterium]